MTISDAKRNQKRPHRLTARTAGSHPANRSSILREVTITITITLYELINFLD